MLGMVHETPPAAGGGDRLRNEVAGSGARLVGVRVLSHDRYPKLAGEDTEVRSRRRDGAGDPRCQETAFEGPADLDRARPESRGVGLEVQDEERNAAADKTLYFGPERKT